jgi:hypothetical protein
MPDLARMDDGKKYMWDGKEYATEDEAKKVAEEYASNGFETLNVTEEGKFFVYSRRLVTEVVVEGAPPM